VASPGAQPQRGSEHSTARTNQPPSQVLRAPFWASLGRPGRLLKGVLRGVRFLFAMTATRGAGEAPPQDATEPPAPRPPGGARSRVDRRPLALAVALSCHVGTGITIRGPPCGVSPERASRAAYGGRPAPLRLRFAAGDGQEPGRFTTSGGCLCAVPGLSPTFGAVAHRTGSDGEGGWTVRPGAAGIPSTTWERLGLGGASTPGDRLPGGSRTGARRHDCPEGSPSRTTAPPRARLKVPT
jgi:hypothetical protein